MREHANARQGVVHSYDCKWYNLCDRRSEGRDEDFYSEDELRQAEEELMQLDRRASVAKSSPPQSIPCEVDRTVIPLQPRVAKQRWHWAFNRVVKVGEYMYF